jgi:hypothetical protein
MDWLPLLASGTTPATTTAPATTTTASDDNPFQPVLDFFDGATFQAIVKLFGLMLVALWLASAFFVFKDARRRIADPVLIGVAVATAIVFPFVGVLIYTILRPPEYLDDVRERELEIRAIEKRLSVNECPKCHAEVEPDFLVCPVCATKLRRSCEGCQRPLEPTWRVCPYCETPVAPAEGPVPLHSEGAPRRTRKAR